ncbi:MAG: RagB/SusD family nutrient uptake outer membrane protein, partial [Cyclobacteriaceae bacterium]
MEIIKSIVLKAINEKAIQKMKSINYKKSIFTALVFTALWIFSSCGDLLNPQPVDRISDELVIQDVGSARVALNSVYRAFVSFTAPKIIAGDLTADNLIHNGTFTQYLEISNKQMSASNESASAMWSVIYSLAYRANFLLEGLENISISENAFDEFTATARFFRGYAYFVGLTTFGGIPIVTNTEIAENRVIPRSSIADVRAFIEEDLLYALNKLPLTPINAGELSNGAVKALLARFYLYTEDWEKAELFASEVIQGIGTRGYTLEADFNNVLRDFSTESILEVIYTANDNPGTSTDFGLNNLFE